LFASLALVELLVVHLVLAHKWPLVAWPLSLATTLVIGWNVLWIRSWRRLPHELHADRLRLHVGSLSRVEVPFATIMLVHGRTDGELLKQRGVHNMVPMAHPNRVLELREALPGRRAARRIAIRVDDPAAFDDAMQAAGIAVEGRGVRNDR
jgi:hypothetical protein